MTCEGIVGNPKNRWFDKTTPTVVFENGLMSSNNDVSYLLTQLLSLNEYERIQGWMSKSVNFSVHPFCTLNLVYGFVQANVLNFDVFKRP